MRHWHRWRRQFYQLLQSMKYDLYVEYVTICNVCMDTTVWNVLNLPSSVRMTIYPEHGKLTRPVEDECAEYSDRFLPGGDDLSVSMKNGSYACDSWIVSIHFWITHSKSYMLFFTCWKYTFLHIHLQVEYSISVFPVLLASEWKACTFSTWFSISPDSVVAFRKEQQQFGSPFQRTRCLFWYNSCGQQLANFNRNSMAAASSQRYAFLKKKRWDNDHSSLQKKQVGVRAHICILGFIFLHVVFV